MPRSLRPLLAALLLPLLTTLALPTSAAELRVYTYSSFVSDWGPGPALKQAFEQQCFCTLEFVSAEDGVSLLNRLRIEGANTRADLMLGLDDALTDIARSEALVQPHGLSLPPLRPELQWNDPAFVPYDFGYFAFVYNRESVTRPARSLKELIDSDARIIYQDPRTSTPGQGLLLWVKAVYGEQSEAAWQRLASHTLTVTKGWWEAYSLFLQGDADYVLSYSTSPAYHSVTEQDERYRTALFSEGHIAQIEVAAISRYSQQPELARDFMRYLLTPEAQAIIATRNWMLPVIEGVTLPEAFDHLIQPRRIGFSPAEIARQRPAWIREWRRAASR
ncbi:thiamine ABC transporter substrate binding subunit [Aestuariirhabdus litorea]|uniref:Thiamine-binding periplasmic protein n=1 Tax=Aestuariirhabdus litorea TaxID=2528527 RepID=A0A3P3VU94_9GAMM|nr:thiamine ABC transporter substrate binding subunit [Aestuariirhabdus litorea]RRJ85186.1 thiamine ABC transporter substrate binding subunit [Aestuariirhabdus litorea]RWW98407.1 thiamine ABC transporter substrate binding subunit [Endozoicomonadaceae bacterium GTF-13]